MKLRRLNDAGIDAFAAYLGNLAQDPALPVPVQLLDDSAHSEPLQTTAAVEAKVFGTRFDAAAYLHGLLTASGLPGIDRDRGLWTWLTLFYFDQLCPADKRGHREPGATARYISELSNWKRFYRHLLAGPYFIFSAHADDPKRAMAVLLSKLTKPGDVVEQIASRQELVTNKAIMGVITKLYVDETANKIKKGAGGKGGGSARRLADVLGQFELTFDLYAITADNLLTLLPREFRRFAD